MNKLLYREIIKHINRSLIKDTTLVVTQQVFTATNPATDLTVMFSKVNGLYETKYLIALTGRATCIFSKTFTNEQLKQLFEVVEKRYEAHFKNHSEDTLNAYRKLLASNNKGNGR